MLWLLKNENRRFNGISQSEEQENVKKLKEITMESESFLNVNLVDSIIYLAQ